MKRKNHDGCVRKEIRKRKLTDGTITVKENYVARIIVDGKLYQKRSKSEKEVSRWLELFKREQLPALEEEIRKRELAKRAEKVVPFGEMTAAEKYAAKSHAWQYQTYLYLLRMYGRYYASCKKTYEDMEKLYERASRPFGDGEIEGEPSIQYVKVVAADKWSRATVELGHMTDISPTVKAFAQILIETLEGNLMATKLNGKEK